VSTEKRKPVAKTVVARKFASTKSEETSARLAAAQEYASTGREDSAARLARGRKHVSTVDDGANAPCAILARLSKNMKGQRPAEAYLST
jgi:hypothetical protein